jgi:hypothetical protein
MIRIKATEPSLLVVDGQSSLMLDVVHTEHSAPHQQKIRWKTPKQNGLLQQYQQKVLPSLVGIDGAWSDFSLSMFFATILYA